MDDPFVETKLGDDGRLMPFDWAVSPDWRGKLSEVRELLNDERKLLKLNSLRTPDGLRFV